MTIFFSDESNIENCVLDKAHSVILDFFRMKILGKQFLAAVAGNVGSVSWA